MSYMPSNPHASLMDIFKRWPEARKGLHIFAQLAMRGERRFTDAECELMAAYVSGLNGCHFCQATHAKVAEAFGVAPGVLETLYADIDEAEVPDRLKPVLLYVGKLTLSPAQMTPQDVEAMYTAGWDEEAVTQAAFICGYFNLMPRIVTGLGLSDAADVIDAAARHVTAHGYT